MKGKGEIMSLQEYERKCSYLLSWEDAEKKVGHKLDWNNNFDFHNHASLSIYILIIDYNSMITYIIANVNI